MICGIGVDAVTIQRFESWRRLPAKTLLKIYTSNELAYCFAHEKKTAERLAVRFAAKEAFYKAASGFFFEKSLYAILRTIAVHHDAHKKPYLAVDWQKLLGEQWRQQIEGVRMHLSLTHTKDTATAFVIIEQIKNS